MQPSPGTEPLTLLPTQLQLLQMRIFHRIHIKELPVVLAVLIKETHTHTNLLLSTCLYHKWHHAVKHVCDSSGWNSLSSQTHPECHNHAFTPQSALNGYEITLVLEAWTRMDTLGACILVSQWGNTHSGEILPSCNMSVGKQRKTSAQQISIVSFLNLSFIPTLVLSHAHLKNIKTQFMEMSDHSMKKHKKLRLYHWFLHII